MTTWEMCWLCACMAIAGAWAYGYSQIVQRLNERVEKLESVILGAKTCEGPKLAENGQEVVT